MEGDFTKLQLNQWDNFTGLLHQQGRGFLDEDFNASTQITGHLRQLLGRDTIGPHVVAVPTEERDSFKVTQAVKDGDKAIITLDPGRVWLDGLVLLVKERSSTLEADYLVEPTPSFSGVNRDAVILEVWEDTFNAFQDPPNLIEPALGGVDTTERIKLLHRLRLLKLGPYDECGDLADRLDDNFDAKGKLTVTPADTLAVTGDCPIEVGGGYTDFSHYLYRIEIATPSDTGMARFKWSRFNGGLVGRGTYDLSKEEVTITANDQMINYCGLDSFYLESLQEGPDGGPWKVTFTANATLSADGKLSLTDVDGTWPDDNGEAFFRLWDGIKLISTYITAKELENGIMLTFDAPAADNSNYKPGDYWTFPVRAKGLDADLPSWPTGESPHGIRYHRAPLAILNWTADPAAPITFNQGEIRDCRRVFQPLTDQHSCCTFIVGDGVRSHGHFNSITEALRHLPAKGGKLCLLPGEHYTNAVIRQRQDIEITGCGLHTIVQPTIDHAEDPIFSIDTSKRIFITNLTLATSTGTAIQVKDDDSLQEASENIRIEGNNIIANTHAIEVRVNNELAGNNDIRIINNEIGMFDKTEGKAAIFCLADNVVIENNRIVVVPAPDPDDPNDMRDPEEPGSDIFELCADLFSFYNVEFPRFEFVRGMMLYIESTTDFKQQVYQAQGGIQIGGGSERVRIIGNRIIGGNGNGITLGHIPSMDDDGSDVNFKDVMRLYNSPSSEKTDRLRRYMVFALYEIAIEDNTIMNMGLSGIGIPAFFNLEKISLIMSVENLVVRRNTITYCAHLLPTEIPEDMIDYVGFGGIVLGACENAIIQENRIENNGRSQIEPVCGILILYGEITDISNNQITNNGPRTVTLNDQNAKAGTRGGIVIKMGFRQILSKITDKEMPLPDGAPAVKIHNNTVIQPLGQALFIIAFGPVSVIGNHFTSQGADFHVNPLSLIAGAVFILNLGIVKDLHLLLPVLQLGFRLLASINSASVENLTFSSMPNPNINVTHPPTAEVGLTGILYKLLCLPSGSVLFTNNKTTLDLLSQDINFALSAQAIASLDDIAYNNNQSECTSLIDLVYTDVFLLGVTIRSNDNRFQEGMTIAYNSLFSLGLMNMATHNQATHCLKVLGRPGTSAMPYTVNQPNMVLYWQNCEIEMIETGNRYVGPSYVAYHP